MLERFRQFWTNVWAPLGNLLLKLGVSPNAVTLVGTLGVCAGALVCFPRGWLLAGVLVITAFVFSDMLDGYMARTSGQMSPFGAFLDSTLDRVGDGAIFGGLVLYYVGPGDSEWRAALALYCLVVGSLTSYARARAESLGMQAKVGIAERSDRLVSILVMTGLADLLRHLGVGDGVLWLIPVTLAVLAVASTVTVVQRILVVRQQALGLTPPTE
ncbi:MAG TPA: CDP-alcohol phosphatidyltransferase family protein [Nocardioides sp.]|jgi:CDP-diacylglycerol--glycerol-3-phosphate 3-phosphatidyltransferase/CDP-diacylglycerol--inositol 3-phosphatidyltransferase|uniref:phosphatidylinositol phosphate synthase n=1 Tax=Nocardioides sp. TaxID=35761 RepID=UPI002E309614|nr:CDP-alcohol phosphatidyltransferase family protein [Nocardioides sp.]HEX3932874.1 CDP-alcohol phosphatidyltransferase family protein [Nocardioides sp.]